MEATQRFECLEGGLFLKSLTFGETCVDDTDIVVDNPHAKQAYQLELDNVECRAKQQLVQSTVMDHGFGTPIHRSTSDPSSINDIYWIKSNSRLDKRGKLCPTVLKCQVIAFTSLTCSTTNIQQRGVIPLGSLVRLLLLLDDWCFQLRA